MIFVSRSDVGFPVKKSDVGPRKAVAQHTCKTYEGES